MQKVNGSSSSPIAATPDAGPSQPSTSSTAGVKRRASSPPPGMPPSAKQKKTASTTSHAPADWHTEATRFGIAGSGIAQTQGGKTAALAAHGTTALQDPDVSPLGALAAARPADLKKKNAAPNAGDHSPSVASVNHTQANQVRVLRGGVQPLPGAFNVGDKNVPTLQFTTDRFKTPNGAHATNADSAAHSAFTSLREMHGVGEQSAHANMDSLLDATARAYSPYNAQGEPSRDGVALPKTNIHSQNVGGARLHKSSEGVDPMIGQQMMNMWYRRNVDQAPMPNETIGMRQLYATNAANAANVAKTTNAANNGTDGTDDTMDTTP